MKTWLPYVQERIPIEEVFEQLKCTKDGLTSEEGEHRLQIFGHNKLEEKKANFFYFITTLQYSWKKIWCLNKTMKQESKILKFLGFMWNPLSWVMECAAIMAIVLANGGVITIIKFSFLKLPLYIYMSLNDE